MAEINDHEIAALLGGGLTGHTLKHLLATLEAAMIVAGLVRRLPEEEARPAVRQRFCRGVENSSMVF